MSQSVDLRQHVSVINTLNVDTETSTISPYQLISKESFDNESYIISDADEELLILIQFKQIIDLHSMKLYSLTLNNRDDEIDASQPKQVYIYNIDSLNKNFDDIQSMKPDKNIKCFSKKLAKGQFINLKKNSKNSVKFKKTKYLAIYIKSNQNDTENTYINGITFKGEHTKSDKDNKIEFKEEEVLTEINITQIGKKRSWTNKNETFLFDTSDTKNKQKFREISKELNQTSTYEYIYVYIMFTFCSHIAHITSYLLFIYHRSFNNGCI